MTSPHVVQFRVFRDCWTTDIRAAKSSVELRESPAPCANKGSGASLAPMTFKHISSNQRNARSVVTNGHTNLCLRDALHKIQLPRKIIGRRPDSQSPTRAVLPGDFHPLWGRITGNSATWRGTVMACPHCNTHQWTSSHQTVEDRTHKRQPAQHYLVTTILFEDASPVTPQLGAAS